MPEQPHVPASSKPLIVVTGSSGIIGSAVIRALLSQYAMVGFDRPGPPYPPPQAECVSVDLRDCDTLDYGMARLRYAYGDRIASVIHLAAYYDFSGEPSDLYDDITVRGTERLLAALEGFEVEQFIFSSTMLVHQPSEPGKLIHEGGRLIGTWAYPQSKIDTEQVIHARRGRIPAVFLRIAGVYTDICDSIPLARQMQRIYENRLTSHLYPGDASRGQAFIHIDDLVDAIVRTVERRQYLPPATAFLIGEPETYSYQQLQRRLGQLMHGEDDWTTQSIPKTIAKTGAWVQDQIPGLEEPFIKPWMIDRADDHYELDITRARSVLGWQPKRRLINVLPHMVGALLQDPAGWYKRHGLEWPKESAIATDVSGFLKPGCQ
jgi:nucleoside-diphosphate-sugar epimerase